MEKVHVVYGSTTGTTETIALRLANDFGTRAINIAGADVSAFDAEVLLLGSSTWGCGDLQDDWYGGLDRRFRVRGFRGVPGYVLRRAGDSGG